MLHIDYIQTPILTYTGNRRPISAGETKRGTINERMGEETHSIECRLSTDACAFNRRWACVVRMSCRCRQADDCRTLSYDVVYAVEKTQTKRSESSKRFFIFLREKGQIIILPCYVTIIFLYPIKFFLTEVSRIILGMSPHY